MIIRPDQLPESLRDPKALVKRRESAQKRKNLWRETYRDAYQYTMPQRETFNLHTEGEKKHMEIFDSTGPECVLAAAQTMQAQLCPSWKHWAQLSPGSLIPEESEQYEEITEGLQEATRVAFSYINHSNFANVIAEAFLDIQVGSCELTCNEADDDNLFTFDAIPLSIIEWEEGPNGTIESRFMKRQPIARNLVRMYPGMDVGNLPQEMRDKILKKPDEQIDIIQACIYEPSNKHYYGIVFDCGGKAVLWAYDYEDSSPHIGARASVTSGEIYGRGPILWALPDIKTLNAMQEFLLTHSALNVAPPITAVSDGVLNPYTAMLAPNTVIPVASNDNGNPSLRVLEVGGNFNITEAIMENLRQQVRNILLGEQSHEGAVKSATEWAISDRNRLWMMNAVYGRIQSELLSKVMARVIWILQRAGKIPPLKVDGKEVTLKYVSPLARAQDQDDMLALQQTLEISNLLGPEAVGISLKIEDIPGWVARKSGLDAKLVRSAEEKEQIKQTAAQAAQAQMAAQQPTAQAAA